MNSWTLLILAGLLEVCWAVGLKYTQGFTRLVPSLLVGVALAGSMWLLALAVRTLPIGTAYAVWVGIGAVGTALLGMMLFNEPRDPARIACLALIIAGVLGLRLLDSS